MFIQAGTKYSPHDEIQRTSMNHSSYIRFLNCIDALEAKGGVTKLDAIETQLLDWIMMTFSQGGEILVGDLLVLSHIGSQATLHGRLQKLITLGYVKQALDSVDGRKKKILPTKIAIKRYEILSKLLEKSISA